MANLTCCIHITNDNGNVRRFTEKTLEKCKTVLRARQYHKIAHCDNIQLPIGIDSSFGFHSSCYSRFTAIKSILLNSVHPDWTFEVASCSHTSTSNATEPKTERLRRVKSVSSSGVLHMLCVFCGKRRRTYKTNEQILITCATTNFESTIRHAAEVLNDWEFLSKIFGGDFVAKEVRYHKICATEYRNKARRKLNSLQSTTVWHNIRQSRKEAFCVLCDFVNENIILKDNICTLKELFKVYCEALKEIDPSIQDRDVNAYSKKLLSEKLMTRFQGSLRVDRSEKEHIFMNTRIQLLPTVRKQKLQEMHAQSALRNVAYTLRKEILSIEKQTLSGEICATDIMQGECNIPTKITTFLQHIVEGPATHRGGTDVNKRRLSSLAQDLIFTTTNDQVKPEKHLTLGMTMKSLTGSRKVVDILNRFGHCSSYSTIEELETELSYASTSKSKLLPHGFHCVPYLSTNVAFDNYDRYVETLSGKNTLHDTVGIVYQNVPSENLNINLDEVQQSTSSQVNEKNERRKRRCFQELFNDVVPYMKKPKLHLKVKEHETGMSKLNKDYRVVDLVWQMSIYYNLPSTPMWVGYNSYIFEDHLPIQKIAYLPQINVSPTSYDAVQQTLKMALEVASECRQEHIMCTYDLAIAKMALKIQSEESPTFDNVFIMFGMFHIELAFFKALGKIINNSGITDILIDAGLLAQGSLNGFLQGTHYNRCRRLHPIVGVALRMLHYDLFLKKQPLDDRVDFNVITNLLQTFKSVKQNISDQITIEETLLNHINSYVEFEKDTRNGQHGLTAQFWIMYLDLIDLYHDFNRSVRMGDVHLLVRSLDKIIDIFFAVNHPNYARWMVVFYDKLMKEINEDKSEHLVPSDFTQISAISHQLKNGFFSIRRTNKNFSRTPPDLTLEQTINADAGNKMTGVSSFTNSIAARQRWAVTHSDRTSIISHVMDKAGLVKSEDVSKETKDYRITKDGKDVMALVESVKNAINPFDESLDNNSLFNLSSGKAAREETKTFLLGLRELGHEQHKSFRRECAEDFARFERPIKKNKLCTFAAEGVALKLRKKDKVIELKIERDLFGRLIALSRRYKLDLKTVLEYPLTPIPLSLCHPDGTLQKTNKSTLMRYIEKMVDHDIPDHIDEKIIDGFHFIHQLVEFPPTFGGIAKLILKKLEKMKVSKIHLVFDNYVSPSIKDSERSARAKDEQRYTPYHISGSRQTRPPDFLKALRKDTFKNAFVNFLVEEWNQDEYAAFFMAFNLYATYKYECYYYLSTVNNNVERHAVSALHSTHLEADSRMVYHLSQVTSGNVVVSSADTDVFIILIGNLHHINKDVKVWLETGKASKNDRRFLNIRKISENLGSILSRSMPAFHAFTGSDYTAALYRVGKINPFKHLQNSQDVQLVLASFQDETRELTNDEMKILERFVCSMYRSKKFSSVNELRLNIFLDTYQPKDYEKETCQPFRKMKGIEPASMPPCRRVLEEKRKRCQYVTAIWSNLHHPNPPPLLPEIYGWELDGNLYKPLWYRGECVPEQLGDVLVASNNEEEKDDEENDDELDVSSGDEDDEDTTPGIDVDMIQ